MRKLVLAAASAAALAIGSAANAAVVVTVPSPPIYTPPTSGGLIGQVAAGTSSNDSFIFTISGATSALFSGQLSTTSLGPTGQGNINFTNILIDGMANMFTLTSIGTAPEQWSCCQPGGNGTLTLAPGQHTLSYTATNTSNVLGTYSGTFNFGSAPAVPEPASWGLMLLGFFGVGMALRRSRKPGLAQIA